jgi:hypothetical protein
VGTSHQLNFGVALGSAREEERKRRRRRDRKATKVEKSRERERKIMSENEENNKYSKD